MAFFFGEEGSQVGMNQFVRQLAADHPSTQDQNIHVVVLDALTCRIGIMAKRRANARQLVCRHRGTHPAATDENAAIGFAIEDNLSHGLGIIWVIHRIHAVCAQINHLVTQITQIPANKLLQRESGVIRTDSDAHFLSLQ